MLARIFSVFFLLIQTFLGAQPADSAYVILVSFDGFRNDYVEKFDASNFKSFIADGASAEGLIPAMPSKTFPNHYTIVTGMYPGTHGLVDNMFYDKEERIVYKISDREAVENPDFYGGLPLWQLAQENGLKTASYFWVGSEAPIRAQFPTYYYRYDERVTNETRVDQAINWLQLPLNERPRLITLYFSLVDDAGHDFGPNAPELGEAVLEADTILHRLMTGLDSINLPVNVILTSDHGMLEMKNAVSTYLILEQLPGYSDTTLRWVNNGTHVHIYNVTNPNTKKLKQIKKHLEAEQAHYQVWLGKQIPKRWHYRHTRVGDIFLVADPGYYFINQEAFNQKQKKGMLSQTWGTHGFNPEVCPQMQGIFYANGPNIRQGMRLSAFKNIHIYPLVATLLQLPIPHIGGNLDVLKVIIKK